MESKRAKPQFKQRIVTLDPDNANQEEWISSLRNEARTNNIIHLVMKGMSESRDLETADLIASARDSSKGDAIKTEEAEDAEGDEKADEKSAQAAKGGVIKEEANTPIAEVHTLLDLSQLDDHEDLVMRKVRVFLDVYGNPENKVQSKRRFSFSNQLVLSAPHHKHKLRTWVEGDIYGFIKLVTIDVRRTGRTLYNEISALGAVHFRQGDRIDDIINRLYHIQTRTNTLAPDKICEEMMRGAFLTCCAKHPDFKQLAMDFSKKACTLSLDEIHDEMREHESNIKRKEGAAQGQGRAMQAKEASANDHTMAELKAMILALVKPKEKGKKEQCRNHLKGACRFGSNCHFLHGSGNNNKSARESKGAKKLIKCYNCQKLGTHIAANCPLPKVVRQDANAATEAKEGETSLEEFLQQLRAKSDNQRANSLIETSEPSEKPPFAGLASLAHILLQVNASEGTVSMEEFLELLIFTNKHTTAEERLRYLAEGARSCCDEHQAIEEGDEFDLDDHQMLLQVGSSKEEQPTARSYNARGESINMMRTTTTTTATTNTTTITIIIPPPVITPIPDKQRDSEPEDEAGTQPRNTNAEADAQPQSPNADLSVADRSEMPTEQVRIGAPGSLCRPKGVKRKMDEPSEETNSSARAKNPATDGATAAPNGGAEEDPTIFSSVYQPMRRSEVGHRLGQLRTPTSKQAAVNLAKIDQNLQVFVVGGPLPLCLNALIPTWTTNMLKILIALRCEKAGYRVESDDFYLVCAGKIMRGNLTLREQNVQQNARIEMCGRLRGGMSKLEGKHDQGTTNYEEHMHHWEENAHARCELSTRGCLECECKEPKQGSKEKNAFTRSVEDIGELRPDERTEVEQALKLESSKDPRPAAVPPAMNFGAAGALSAVELANFQQAFEQLAALEKQAQAGAAKRDPKRYLPTPVNKLKASDLTAHDLASNLLNISDRKEREKNAQLTKTHKEANKQEQTKRKRRPRQNPNKRRGAQPNPDDVWLDEAIKLLQQHKRLREKHKAREQQTYKRTSHKQKSGNGYGLWVWLMALITKLMNFCGCSWPSTGTTSDGVGAETTKTTVITTWTNSHSPLTCAQEEDFIRLWHAQAENADKGWQYKHREKRKTWRAKRTLAGKQREANQR